jgi:hypothetical protein
MRAGRLFHRLGTNLWALRWFHLAGAVLGAALVHVSQFPMGALSFGQPFRTADVPALGVNLLSVERPAGTRFAAATWDVVPGAARRVEAYLDLGADDYLTVAVDPARGVRVGEVRGGDLTVLARAPTPTRRIEVRADPDAWAVVVDGVAVFKESRAIPEGAEFYARFGAREATRSVSLPRGFTVRVVGIGRPERTRDLSFSWAQYAAFLAIAGGVVYLLLVLGPALPVAPFVSARTLGFILAVLPPLIPLWPTLYYFQVGRHLYDGRAAVVDEAQGTLDFRGLRVPLKESGGAATWLFIGGSAGTGAPFARRDSVAAGLERIASHQGTPLRVVNLSQGGWDAGLWTTSLPALLDALRPDVVLAYFAFNSILQSRRPIVHYLLPTLNLLNAVHRVPTRWIADPAGVPRVLGDFDRIQERVAARGARLVVLDDPVAQGFLLESMYAPAERRLVAHLAQRGVPVVPLYDRFRAADVDSWFYDVCHLTRAGYARAADMTWEYLVGQGIAPREGGQRAAAPSNVAPEHESRSVRGQRP